MSPTPVLPPPAADRSAVLASVARRLEETRFRLALADDALRDLPPPTERVPRGDWTGTGVRAAHRS